MKRRVEGDSVSKFQEMESLGFLYLTVKQIKTKTSQNRLTLNKRAAALKINQRETDPLPYTANGFFLALAKKNFLK